MKKLISFGLIALVAVSASAQVVLSNFTTAPGGANFTTGLSWSGLDQNTPQLTIVSNDVLVVGPVSGGNPTDNGYMNFADISGTIPLNGANLLSLTVTARLDAGNAASGFTVNLFDDQGTGALTATFATGSFVSGSFTSVTSTLSAHPGGGVLAAISSFGIAGAGNGAAFRMSFDQVVANVIPEPSTYAAIAGAVMLGFVAYRRRRQQLAAAA